MKTCKPHVVGCALLALAACSKTESGTSGVPPATSAPRETPIISITATPVAPASALAPASASPLASASVSATATPPASPASATPPASPASASARASSDKSPDKPPPGPPLEPASARLSGKNFTLDVASPGCRVDVPCAATLRLTAGGDYHVNKEYPYKFTAHAAPAVEFLGKGSANTFSRASGDFREDGEKAATMTIRFKPTAAGGARVAGTYKMSVCSAENCQIETAAVSLLVPVK